MFLAAGEKPKHEVVRNWVRGFGKAMALTPEGWSSLAEDESQQPLLTFIGFLDVKDPDFEPADNIDELLDEAGPLSRAQPLSCARLLSSEPSVQPAAGTKSATTIHTPAVQASSTSDDEPECWFVPGLTI